MMHSWVVPPGVLLAQSHRRARRVFFSFLRELCELCGEIRSENSTTLDRGTIELGWGFIMLEDDQFMHRAIELALLLSKRAIYLLARSYPLLVRWWLKAETRSGFLSSMPLATRRLKHFGQFRPISGFHRMR